MYLGEAFVKTRSDDICEQFLLNLVGYRNSDKPPHCGSLGYSSQGGSTIPGSKYPGDACLQEWGRGLNLARRIDLQPELRSKGPVDLDLRPMHLS